MSGGDDRVGRGVDGVEDRRRDGVGVGHADGVRRACDFADALRPRALDSETLQRGGDVEVLVAVHEPARPVRPRRPVGRQAFGVAVADVNRDRRPDIVAATVNSRARPYESRLAVLLGDTFDVAPGSPFPVGPGAYQLAVGDVDEDGKPDVVTSSFEGDSIAVLLGR